MEILVTTKREPIIFKQLSQELHKLDPKGSIHNRMQLLTFFKAVINIIQETTNNRSTNLVYIETPCFQMKQGIATSVIHL